MTAVRDLLSSSADAHDFTCAPCIGRWALFDSAATYETADDAAERHGRAQSLCALCPHEHTSQPASRCCAPSPNRTAAVSGQGKSSTRCALRSGARHDCPPQAPRPAAPMLGRGLPVRHSQRPMPTAPPRRSRHPHDHPHRAGRSTHHPNEGASHPCCTALKSPSSSLHHRAA